jgi:hypothetical protein
MFVIHWLRIPYGLRILHVISAEIPTRIVLNLHDIHLRPFQWSLFVSDFSTYFKRIALCIVFGS